jgi:NTE family protein
MSEGESHVPAMTSTTGAALALQGGGVHGAYAWGAVDRLIEDGLVIGRVCGVSSGALLGTMLVQGFVRGGADGARRQMKRLWARIAQANVLSPMQNGPLERWLWGADLSNNLVWQGFETALRLFSPAQINPFGHNPLRPVISDLIDREALTHRRAIPLTVAATDVESGASFHWTNADITVDVLLASCCLPFVFHPVAIDGRSFWDGGYSGNPPLAPLLHPMPPDELVLVRAQAGHRPGAPTTPAEILNRLNEIACHGVLEAELRALPPTVRLTEIDAEAALASLPVSSKFNADEAFLGKLFEAGRIAASLARGPARAAAD